MKEIIATVAGTPLANLLVIAGIVFLLLSVAGKITAHLVVPETRKKQAMVLGLVLLGAGLVLNFQPASQTPGGAETAAAAIGESAVVPNETWAGMSEARRAQWSVLGWTAESWAGTAPKPVSEGKSFVALSEAEREAVTQLGYTAETWDAR